MSRIDDILKTAKEHGASDVHITVGIPPKMRVNGKLIALEGYNKMLPDDTREIADTIMSVKQKELLEANGQHDMSFSIMGLGRFRLNVFKQRGSIAMAIRLVETTIPDAETLGIPSSVINLYQRQRGLVLVTGPTGSGKSTTLASIIDMINSNREAHIITLEDPIEFLYHHDKSIVNQREVGLDSDNYANALRAALREDPDVILVGEMRDLETISTAITAAETGHLVLSTLHTIGAASTVDRIIDVFPPHQQQQIRIQLANVLEAVISQQLIPTIDEEARVAAFEVMHVNSAVRNMIREGKTHQLITIMQTNRKLGMVTMDEAIIDLCRAGKISRDKAIQYAQDPEVMQNKILR
ncbi:MULTISPECIES: type IV pilus twitching motility protein PilT [unclassified Butyrivibrio]|uniref:type IV pilus twitching motility protein PilT n=1 Tax=unclassified Butyrivibrio TaxID=2639466 RepID=UPI0003B34466|nr:MULTISPECIES: type IV pilus twitching motility protein PilT [unclassified Butyrivibrio]SDB32524.1 twitching motility protein PilT [Butyrivibrio sp. INlla16]SEL54273.1 twitching motility protein PilT [Butyrivibrio sp. ob235]